MEEDINEVIRIADHYRHEENLGRPLLHFLSSLPSSKRNMKRAIKQRVQALYTQYISLATFIHDDDADFLLEDHDTAKKRKRKRQIFRKVLKDMERLEKELREFDPLKSD